MKTLTLKTIAKTLIIASALSAVSLPTIAKNHHHKAKSQATYGFAKVVNVEPVYKHIQVNHPVEKCYDKRVPVNYQSHNGHSSHRNSNYTNEVIGGVIGAAVGNQVAKNGRGNSREVATVVGAVLGAAVANKVERKDNRYNTNHRNGHYSKSQHNRGYKVVQHCELHDSYHSERKVVGYDVAYKYYGNVYYTHLNHHPGHKIKVKVSVKPV